MCFNGYMNAKKAFSKQPESLFSMALFDSMVRHEAALVAPTPAFYPVDEYKDLSLKEILDISDDFLFGEDDPLMTANVHDTGMLVSRPDTARSSFPVPSARSDNFVEAIAPLPVQSTYNAIPTAPLPELNSKKRSYDESFDEDDDEDEEGRRFRPYQAGQWTEKFDELCEYRKKMGHCLVPHTYRENLPLARWVKRQRYQYKLMMEGKPSTMTEDRVRALEEIGFVWDSQGAAWEERLDELREFCSVFHHCNVPSNYNENPQLATWVKCQRRQYKLHVEGKPSNMTTLRVQQLEGLGFEWELRSYRKTRN